MSDTDVLRQELDASVDRFEQYRASVSTAIDERPPGELSRDLDAILPELVFYEGQAYAAGLGLARIGAGGGVDDVARVLSRGLIEQQAARRGHDFLAGFAATLARVTHIHSNE